MFANRHSVDHHHFDARRFGDQAVGGAGQVMDAAQRTGADGVGIEQHQIGGSADRDTAAIAQPGLPVISPVTEFRDVFGVALTNMINGADPATELKKATAEFQPVLDKSEKA